MGKFQIPTTMKNSLLLENSCGYLLQELELIWDEIGEDQSEREKLTLDLEQECLEVCRRKVDYANMARTRLHQELAVAESEFAHLLLLLGERYTARQPDKKKGNLKQQLEAINAALKETRQRQQQRVNQFKAVQGQIHKITAELECLPEYDDSASNIIVNENDISLKKLEEYQVELQRLQNEKRNRIQKVERYICRIKDLSAMMGTDFSLTITKIHPSLNDSCGIAKNISDNILAKLRSTVESLEEEKRKRLDKLNHLAKAVIDLWDLLETPKEQRQKFSHITNMLSASPTETYHPSSLTISIIQQAEEEVERLGQLKASKMKEIFLRKHYELEEICRESHMGKPSKEDIDEIMSLMGSGEIDSANLLISMDKEIAKAQKEANSRGEILQRIEKWMTTRNEELWLEEYNRDENRYTGRKSCYRNLKRAERARVTVSKIPAMVDSLISKIKIWEREQTKVFMYDEVPLLTILEEYNLLRHEKEEEKLRQRLGKKMGQNRGTVELEIPFCSEPFRSSSNRRIPNRSLNESFYNASPDNNRRVTQSIQQLRPGNINFSTQSVILPRKSIKQQGPKMKTQPPDFTSVGKEEMVPPVVYTFSSLSYP